MEGVEKRGMGLSMPLSVCLAVSSSCSGLEQNCCLRWVFVFLHRNLSEQELLWRPMNKQHFKGNKFHYIFMSLFGFFFVPGGLYFWFCLL